MKKILITGGAGFIGSHFTKYMLSNSDYQIIVVDKITYAGNINNLFNLEEEYPDRFFFYKIDICDSEKINYIFEKSIDIVVNFAAETHVDRSIINPATFAQTNIIGTLTLLQTALSNWKDFSQKLFIQISTDEVYGSLQLEDTSIKFTEESILNPSSPYSASKASADLLAKSFQKTYGLPVIITRCSNNYGPNQYPEKLIPLVISKALKNENIPLYGDGQNIRDWIYVEDNVRAIAELIKVGKIGNIYNIGANNELSNLTIVQQILTLLDKPLTLIEFVADRLGHDLRYAISAEKIKNCTSWAPIAKFDTKLAETIEFYKKTLN